MAINLRTGETQAFANVVTRVENTEKPRVYLDSSMVRQDEETKEIYLELDPGQIVENDKGTRGWAFGSRSANIGGGWKISAGMNIWLKPPKDHEPVKQGGFTIEKVGA